MLAKKLLLVVASGVFATVLFIVGYEIYGRVEYGKWQREFEKTWLDKTTIPSPDKELLWEYRPYGVMSCPLGTTHLNRYGYRDFDYKVRNRPEGVYRIAFAGDSITLGWAVNDDECFVRQYNQIVDAKYPNRKIQALNFAVDGYSTLQVLEMIRVRVLPFEPNKVVYVMCLNDFMVDGSPGDKTEYFKPPTSFFLRKLNMIRYENSKTEIHQYYYNQNREVVFDAVLAMQDILKQKKVGFYVVIMPILARGEFAGGSFSTYSLTFMHREIGAFLEEHQIEYHDLLSAFQHNTDPPKNLPNDPWHPNPLGHRLIAEELAKAVPLQ